MAGESTISFLVHMVTGAGDYSVRRRRVQVILQWKGPALSLVTPGVLSICRINDGGVAVLILI